MFDTPGLKENIIHGKSQAWNDKEVKCNFTDWWKQKVQFGLRWKLVVYEVSW